MYWQRAVYFPLVDHLVQELNGRLLPVSEENRFLGQNLVPAVRSREFVRGHVTPVVLFS